MFGSEKIHVFLASLKSMNRSARTLQVYEAYLESLGRFAFSQNTEIHLCDTNLLEGWVQSMRDGKLADETIYTRVMAMRSFFRWLYERDHIARDPSKSIRFRRRLRLPVPPDLDAVRTLLASCDPATWHGARDQAALLVLYGTGCRISELCGMTVYCLNFNEFRVVGKGNKERSCLLPDQAVASLQNWIMRYRSEMMPKTDALFVTEIGTAMTPNIVRKMMGRRRKACGIDVQKIYASGHSRARLTPHSIRHLFATELMENGAQIRAIQELLGHSSIQSTQVYTHVTQDARRKAHSLLPRI
jgi:site-specific recombinase XerD